MEPSLAEVHGFPGSWRLDRLQGFDPNESPFPPKSGQALRRDGALLGFILPRVFPSADAARPDAAPSALELPATPLPCGSGATSLHGVSTFGESGVFSLESANPSEVPPLGCLADSKRPAALGY